MGVELRIEGGGNHGCDVLYKRTHFQQKKNKRLTHSVLFICMCVSMCVCVHRHVHMQYTSGDQVTISSVGGPNVAPYLRQGLLLIAITSDLLHKFLGVSRLCHPSCHRGAGIRGVNCHVQISWAWEPCFQSMCMLYTLNHVISPTLCFTTLKNNLSICWTTHKSALEKASTFSCPLNYIPSGINGIDQPFNSIRSFSPLHI